MDTPNLVLPAYLADLIKSRARRLLVIGRWSRSTSDLPADEIIYQTSLGAATENRRFDRVICDGVGPEDRLRRLPAHLDERARVFFVVTADEHRDAIGRLSKHGFAIHKEHTMENGDLLISCRATEFTVRSFTAGDEQDILRMFKPSFHVERSPEHWRWKFEENPFGSRKISIARGPDGELAAHYAGYPVIFNRFAKDPRDPRILSWVGLQIGDTMTLPRFRTVGRGPTSLLGRCVRHFLATHGDQQAAFNFGFNTGNIQKFSRLFVRAELVEPLGYWIRPPDLPAARLARYRVSRVDRFGPRWDRFFHRVGHHYGLLVRRDAQWLQWRYGQCPDAPGFITLAAHRWGRMVAWSVFRRHGNHLRWCDALFDPQHVEAGWSLLKTVLKSPEMADIEGIEAWFPDRPEWWREQLVTLGFEPAREPNDLALMTTPLQVESGSLLKDLYYTMGDSDLA